MTAGEDRPRPQYGEYATPEEVAAARGPLPAVPAEALRIEPGRAEPVRVAPDRPASARPGGSARPIPRPARAGNLITTLLLVFGIWYTVTSIPGYLEFDVALSQTFALLGYGTVAFGAVAHTAGIVLLAISLLVLIAALGISLRLMRDGRRAIWVPLAAAAFYLIVSVIVTAVIVANTPGLAQVLHNH